MYFLLQVGPSAPFWFVNSAVSMGLMRKRGAKKKERKGERIVKLCSCME
jgi:hypothetical protein